MLTSAKHGRQKTSGRKRKANKEQPRDLPEDVPRAKRQKSSEQPVKHRLSRTTPEGMDMSGPGEWQKPLPQLEEQQRHQHQHRLGAVISPATRVSQNPLKLEAYLTPEVVAAFALKHDLYPWQGECLNLPGVLGGRNLVFSAPTSAGKSLIAETLMLRRSIITGKMSLLVLPYNALCQEKTQHLSHLYAPLGKRVAANYGGLGKRDDLNTDVGCLVCTIERANVLVNRLIEEDRLDDLCCIVVDEVHMADDATRGYLLELLLTKVQFKMASVSGDSQSQGGVQLVAMSATVPNMAAIARWLNAALYETEFRPVQLKRFLKVGHTIRDQDLEIIRTLPQDERFSSLHPPTAEMLAVAQLCEETVQGGHSVLVFCGTKRACEQVAKVIGSKLTVPERQLKCAGEDLPADRADVLARLAKLQADHPLIPVMSQGVAYHNSSLSHDERELVEAAFKTGAISVLVATSTVATGVNLPARRVIIKDRYQGLDRKESYLSSATYHQMCGRAGRAGIDSQGEAIIFARSGDYQDVAAMMREGAQPISSCLAEERRGLKHAMQEVVATGAVRTAADCQNYCKCTLLAATTDPKIVVSAFRAAGKWLADNGLITWVSEKDTGYYQPTALGKATLVSGMSLEEALVVKEEIERAHHGFVMSTDLHLTYLITPFREDIGIDWDVFHAAYSNLKGPDAKVAELVGIKQSFVISQMRCKGQRKNMTEAHKESERICKRFLAALVLNDLIQEMNLDDVVEKYKVNKAGVRAMQERAGSFAMMLAAFCGRMGWGNMETIMAKFQSRVSHGVRPEIVELIRIDGIKAYRARQLYSAGLRTPAEVALSTVHQLTRIFEQGARGGNEAEQKEAAKRAAWKVYKAARLLAQEELREEQAKNEKLRLNLAACDSQGSTPAGSIKTPAKTPTQSLTARIQDHTKGLVLVEGLTMIKSFCERWVRQKQYAFAIDVRGSTTPEAEREAMKASLPKGPGIASSAGKPALAVRSGPRIAGVAVCWDRERAFYILLPAQNAAEAWKVVMEALSGPAEKITHDLKPQLVGLLQAAISQDGPQPADPLVDVRIAAWMLAPDGDIDNVSAVSDNPACKRVIRSGIGALPLEALLESRAGAAVVAEAKQTLQQDPGQKPDAFKGDRLAACKRAVLSFRLFERLQPQMQVQGLLPPLAKVEMLIVRVLAHMEHIGIAADPDVFTQNDEPLRRRQEELEVKAVALVARSFNLDSPKEVSMVLFEVLKLPVPPYAQKLKGGQYSTCDKVLQELMTQHAIVPVISEHRMVSKVRGSFHDDYMPVISRQATGSAGSGIAAALARSQQEAPVAGEQGRKTRVLARIHGSFFQTATATGRLAMGDPNLQCVPKPRSFEVTVTQASKDTQEQTWRTHTTNLRAAFVAERGFVLLSADYNQIELRIMAHFSGDEALCKLLCDLSQDPFRNLAAQWLKLPLEQVKPEQRDHAKALSYGLLYGKGPHALAADLDCTPNDAVKHMDSFFASIPGVKAWTKSLVEECRKTTFIQTLAGRRRYLPGIGEQGPGASAERAAAERKAINSFCQGSAADMIKLAMINVHAELASSFPADACRLILQIHDELLFEVRAGVLPEAARLVRRCMEGVVSFRVPLPVKLHSGPSWGELEPFHLD
ncbi:hypothetical protein WJX72_009203 [[Myrmecia] bisecta]|uniref:DNA-directed DNA polymerase n=1 Tax=[Myrmecia] bisecta TaxID=41462 RepID=A0AAW1QSP3_9CHLO